MQHTETMQTTPCQCPTFTGGIKYGAGLAIGIGLVGAAVIGISALLKKR